MKKKKIAYVTGTRADFGIMKSILRAIYKSPKLDLQLYATGIHLMPEFGRTINEVKKDFQVKGIINSLFKNDTSGSMAEFGGSFLPKVIRVFKRNRPDFVLILGDRVEEFFTATACLYLGIPMGHFRGGERTSTVDEIARHANTKMANLHFVATKEAARRIEKMGEEKWRIKVVGEASLDIILNAKLPTREELFDFLKLDLAEKIILVTQHSVTVEQEKAGEQMKEVLKAVKLFDLSVVVIYPNADEGGRKIIKVIEREKSNPRFRIYKSIPFETFLALERESAVWVGNSSGAMVESSSFKTPVVNIGTRQLNRLRGKNVLDVKCNTKAIRRAIHKSLYNKAYLSNLKNIKNPWGDGKTGPRVAKILENLDLFSEEIRNKLLAKQTSY